MKHINEIYQSAKDQTVHEAKMRELNSWREQNVYKEIPNKYLMKVNRHLGEVGEANQKLSLNNIVQKAGSVVEGLKNHNVSEQTHQLVQEKALALL